VCSLDIFPTYFRLSLPEGSVSRNEMQAILALTGDAEVFGLKLLELADQRRSDGTTQVGVVLERLLDYARDDIPVEAIPSIVKALFGVGDKLIRAADEDVGFFNRGNDVRVTLLIEKLIPRLDPPDRYTVLKEGIENGQAVYIIVSVTTGLGIEHGRLGREPLPEDVRTVNATQLGELEALAAGKISEAAQHPAHSSDSLLKVHSFGRVLHRWQDWGGQEQVIRWVERMLNEVTDDSQVTDQQLTTLRQFAESYRASRGT
jgi:predicted KAP-like P-loop ATPase